MSCKKFKSLNQNRQMDIAECSDTGKDQRYIYIYIYNVDLYIYIYIYFATLSRIKFEEVYFFKEVCSFVIIVSYVSAYICICIVVSML